MGLDGTTAWVAAPPLAPSYPPASQVQAHHLFQYPTTLRGSANKRKRLDASDVADDVALAPPAMGSSWKLPDGTPD